MPEADVGSREGGRVGRCWGTAEVSGGFEGGGGRRRRVWGPAAEAVVLIPSWQAEEKCEGLCAEEAIRHREVLCVLSVKGTESEALTPGGGTQRERRWRR